MTEKKEKLKPIPLRMSAEAHRRLKIMAAENSTTMGGAVEELLNAYDLIKQVNNKNAVISGSK